MVRTDPILDIVAALQASADLRQIFNGSSSSTSQFCFPELGYAASPSIIYEHYTVSDNKAKQQIRLMLRIVCADLATAYTAERTIQDLLITLGDEPFNNVIVSIKLNGGGHLYDPDSKLYHRIAYFDVIAKT